MPPLSVDSSLAGRGGGGGLEWSRALAELPSLPPVAGASEWASTPPTLQKPASM